VFIRVQEVTPDKVIVTVKDPKDRDAKAVTKEIPAGFVLWSTGIGESRKGSHESRSATDDDLSDAALHEETRGHPP
jgi:NADH dehydrogenase FAD-containing subunit